MASQVNESLRFQSLSELYESGEIPRPQHVEQAAPEVRPPSRGRFVAGGYEVPFGYEEDLLRALKALNAPLRQGPSHLGPRRLDRRLGCGRPAAKRTTSSASGRGDPDLGDEPPGYRPPSREGAVV